MLEMVRTYSTLNLNWTTLHPPSSGIGAAEVCKKKCNESKVHLWGRRIYEKTRELGQFSFLRGRIWNWNAALNNIITRILSFFIGHVHETADLSTSSHQLMLPSCINPVLATVRYQQYFTPQVYVQICTSKEESSFCEQLLTRARIILKDHPMEKRNLSSFHRFRKWEERRRA